MTRHRVNPGRTGGRGRATKGGRPGAGYHAGRAAGRHSPPPSGGGKKRGGCLPPPALLAAFLAAVVVLYALTRSTS